MRSRSSSLMDSQARNTVFEMLYEMGFCKGIENYSRHFSGKKEGEPPPTLMVAGEKFDAFAQFFFDGLAGAQDGVARGNVVAGREDGVASDALVQAPVEQQRIEQRTRFDLEMLYEMGFCKGIENYSRHFSGKKEGEPETIIDEVLLARCVAFVHAADLGNGNVAFVDEHAARSNSTNLKKSCRKPSSFPPPPPNTKKNTPDKWSNKSSAPPGELLRHAFG
jgi:hypothetical protein